MFLCKKTWKQFFDDWKKDGELLEKIIKLEMNCSSNFMEKNLVKNAEKIYSEIFDTTSLKLSEESCMIFFFWKDLCNQCKYSQKNSQRKLNWILQRIFVKTVEYQTTYLGIGWYFRHFSDYNSDNLNPIDLKCFSWLVTLRISEIKIQSRWSYFPDWNWNNKVSRWNG